MAKKQLNNYLAACQKLGLIPKEAPANQTNAGDNYDYHAHVLRVCIAAENAIEQPDGSFKEWKAKKDGIEVTYTPWFVKSGSGWAYHYYGNWITRTAVGPRLEYKSYDLMKASVKKLSKDYNNYFNS